MPVRFAVPDFSPRAFSFLELCFCAATGGTAAGVKWTVPAAWTEQAARPMRVATYTVPPAKGGEAGECGVFYFGNGQGGTRRRERRALGEPVRGRRRRRKTAVETVNGLQGAPRPARPARTSRPAGR